MNYCKTLFFYHNYQNLIKYPYVPSPGGKLMISGLSCTFKSSCTCIGLGAGKLIPESDLTEKLLANDSFEDKVAIFIFYFIENSQISPKEFHVISMNKNDIQGTFS